MMTNMQQERFQLKPLNRTEMEMAQKLIDREHPIRDTLITVTLPFLKPVSKWLPKCMLRQSEAAAVEEIKYDPFKAIADLEIDTF